MSRAAIALVALTATLTSAPAWAQTSSSDGTPVTITLDSVFYGDNTEFFAPFRTGETILGSWQRLYADIKISKLATLILGAYALERDGSDRRTELARPVAALVMGTDHHRFVIGTLETGTRPWGMGPDRTTPHGLLPPLAIETLWFNRAYEAGLQWITNTDVIKQEVYFDYQKLITAEHREKFDGGIIGHIQRSESAPIALLYQWQVVHHGGQQFSTGTVADSFGYGPGVMLRHIFPVVGKTSLETYGLFSYDRPDREKPALNVKGKAVFARLAAERRGWRGHLIVWKAKTFNHEDGDPNYLSKLPDGSEFPGRRDYAELGLAKLFHPARTVDFEASGRAHLVQGKWGYSYRLLGTVHLGVWHTTFK